MTKIKNDPPYGSQQVKHVNKRPPWQLLAFFAIAVLLILGFFSWFWTAQDEVKLTEESDSSIMENVRPNGLAYQENKGEESGIDLMIGVRPVDEGTVVELLPTVAPLTQAGQIVQARGKIKQVITPSAFTLDRQVEGQVGGVDILVLHRDEEISGGKLDVNKIAVVQGELVRFSAATLAPIVGMGLSVEDLEKFEGMPTIITSTTLSH
ncbi:MAG: hypothetical protein ACOH5I_09510 [Oligoflexus sp.]